MILFYNHSLINDRCRQIQNDGSSQDTLEESDTEMDITSTATNDYFDPNDPALLVGKHPLSDDAKLTLLTSKFNCPSNFVFPATSGRFNLSWTVHRPWLRYSMSNNSAYCLPCLCFATSVESESPFTSTGFKKALGKKNSLLDKHKESEAHKLADKKASIMAKEVGIQQVRTKKGILS